MNSYIANFNSESFWRDEQLTRLPAIADDQADVIVGVMDELQFVFAETSDDRILTRLPMNAQHVTYLREIGINFSNNQEQIAGRDSNDVSYFRENLFELLCHSKLDRPSGAGALRLSPFAILPFTDELHHINKFSNSLPTVGIVREVNSKEFSHFLARDIFGDAIGSMVYAADELMAAGLRLLNEGAFLIKDIFGVSGKGNLKIDTELVLKRICKYIKKQEEQGLSTRFLIEPFLDKAFDFCCQFNIDEQGKTTIISVHKFHNTGFAFSGSREADEGFNESLEGKGYFQTMREIGKRLFDKGYFGDVCIDSMMLTNAAVVPIVEINARKSMSLINHHMNKRLQSNYGKSGMMHSFSFTVPAHLRFSHLFDELNERGILFTKDSASGVLPLSANTFDVNGIYAEDRASVSYKGKFYASVIASGAKEENDVMRSLKNSFSSLNLTVTS
jgi:hypothetical protein